MLNVKKVEELIARCIDEDVGMGDLTANLMIDEAAEGSFNVNAREPIVVAGIDVARMVFEYGASEVKTDVRVRDGTRVEAGTVLMHVAGPARQMLTTERTSLNLLQHMCGIATLTATYVEKIKGTGCQLIDTRKTTPGLRMIEKHAVVCGGGRNHRLSLDNGVMIKDNHIAVSENLTTAIQKVKAQVPVLTKVEV